MSRVVVRTSVTVPGGDLGSYAHKSVKGSVSNHGDGAQILRSRYGMSRVVVQTSVTVPGGDLGSHARHVKGGSWASMTVHGSFDRGSACQRVICWTSMTEPEWRCLLLKGSAATGSPHALYVVYMQMIGRSKTQEGRRIFISGQNTTSQVWGIYW